MNKYFCAAKRFIADESAVTAIEYGLIAALVGVLVAAGAAVLGDGLSSLLSGIGDTISTLAADL